MTANKLQLERYPIHKWAKYFDSNKEKNGVREDCPSFWVSVNIFSYISY